METIQYIYHSIYIHQTIRWTIQRILMQFISSVYHSIKPQFKYHFNTIYTLDHSTTLIQCQRFKYHFNRTVQYHIALKQENWTVLEPFNTVQWDNVNIQTTSNNSNAFNIQNSNTMSNNNTTYTAIPNVMDKQFNTKCYGQCYQTYTTRIPCQSREI